ncbi:MAG: hypothetical protein Q7R79_04840 [bacterium]|nr:hypothetical protein [bacterium]
MVAFGRTFWKEKYVHIRTALKSFFVSALFVVLFTIHPMTGVAQTEGDADYFLSHVYPVLISEEQLQENNTKSQRQKQSNFLSRTVEENLVCVYAIRKDESETFLLEKVKDIFGANAEEVLHDAALKNFSKLITSAQSPFAFKDATIFSGMMILAHAKKQEWGVSTRSLILIGDEFIKILEEEFGEAMPQDGYLILVLQNELLIAPSEQGNALRLRLLMEKFTREKRDGILVSKKMYRLDHEGIKALFKRKTIDYRTVS